jgi:hypothetical protein
MMMKFVLNFTALCMRASGAVCSCKVFSETCIVCELRTQHVHFGCPYDMHAFMHAQTLGFRVFETLNPLKSVCACNSSRWC